jgi:hypothetical protein
MNVVEHASKNGETGDGGSVSSSIRVHPRSSVVDSSHLARACSCVKSLTNKNSSQKK